MAFSEWWAKIRNKNLEAVFDDDFTQETKSELKRHLKIAAVDIAANFIAKAASQSEFKSKRQEWYYKLNVRPNTDTSATQFWENLVYRLITKNSVLAVTSDSGDLLIADSWVRTEYALYEDVFEGVCAKGYQFNRKFRMNEVIYLEYSTRHFDRAINGLFEDYSELFTKLAAAIGRNSQIRGTVGILADGGSLDDKRREQIKSIVRDLFKSFESDTVAIAPLTNKLEYKEHSNTTGTSNIDIEQLTKLKDDLVNTVADILGVPTALLHGNRAELQDNITAFNKFCLAPLLQKIEDELNAKIIEPKDYSDDTKIEVVGINKPNMFELAQSIDKLIASSTFNPDEIRKELGYGPREDGGGGEYARTKNYEPAKGGEGE